MLRLIPSGFAATIDLKGFRTSKDFYVTNPSSDPEQIHNSLEETFTTVLVSRISHKRLGTRYVRRGLDNDGNGNIFKESQ